MLQVSLASTSFSLPNLTLSFCPAAKGILFKTFSEVFLYIDHSKWLLTDKMFTFYSIGWNLLFKKSSLALYFKIIILFHCFDFFSESQLCMCVCVGTQSVNRVWLFVTPWTVARQALLSVGFSRQEYWSRLPFPSPGDLLDPGTEPTSLCLLLWKVNS